MQKSIPRSACFLFPLSLNVSFSEVPSHNTQMNYNNNNTYRAPISLLLFSISILLSILLFSISILLCFLAIFSLLPLSILLEHNIKCISYCSLWQCNLLCVILQISSTNDCMPLILLTSLISPNFHHIPQEKINPLLYFFAELHSLYSMFQSTTKILSLHDNVLKCTSSTQICSQPHSNIGHHCLQRKQYGLSQLHSYSHFQKDQLA